MKIYTKTGDRGQTGLCGGARVAKDHDRIEACGTVDELGAVLGLARAEHLPGEIDVILSRVEHELFSVGAELAAPDPNMLGPARIGPAHIEAIEAAIDRFQESLAPLKEFILSGPERAAAAMHLARTVCRRAERRVVTLAGRADPPVSEHVLVYLNRLGDLLFVLARAANAAAGRCDVPWDKPGKASGE